MGAQIQITIYGENDEVKQTYSRSFIPWGMVKKALTLIKKLPDEKNIREEDFNAIADLVVSFFGDKFTRKDLEDGASVEEMMSVLRGISTQASTAANPTLPAGAQK